MGANFALNRNSGLLQPGSAQKTEIMKAAIETRKRTRKEFLAVDKIKQHREIFATLEEWGLWKRRQLVQQAFDVGKCSKQR